MTNQQFRVGAPNSAYIGKGVTVKGAIFVPDEIVVDGVVEGDVTAQFVRIGTSGSIKGKVVSTDADISGTLGENTEIKEFLVIRSSGRVEGHVNCGDVEMEKGAVLAGGLFSVYSGADPVNDNDRAEIATSGMRASGPEAPAIDAAE